MEQNIKQLSKRLSCLGYHGFEIKTIVREAIGHSELDLHNYRQCAKTLLVLKKYEHLGACYQNRYSK